MDAIDQTKPPHSSFNHHTQFSQTGACESPSRSRCSQSETLAKGRAVLQSACVVASDSFAEFLCEQLAPLGRITLRRMFGKTGMFCGGVMFGIVSDNMLYLRVDDGNRAAFDEARAFPPLNYEKKGKTIDLAYWRAPERLFDETDDLLHWARLALAAARRVKRAGRG